MDTRRDFIKKAAALAGTTGIAYMLPASIQKALAINPAAGSTFMDAEHIVLLMQENRSFDHTYGSLQGVRGFNDPRAIKLPNDNPVWLQTNKKGETYAPFRFDIKDTKITWMSSLPHSWSNQVDARNDGKYDKWLDSKRSGAKAYSDMPLTLGYYTREDIPFYYALADAFTVCDQHFCSSLTGTTPNRLYFWSGTIREKTDTQANVWNEDADYNTMVSWATFPERLEEQGVSWKVYQNEVSAGVGLEGEYDSWLTSFGDNPLEYFTQYHVKLSPEYIANIPVQAEKIKKALAETQAQLQAAQGSDAEKLQKRLASLQKAAEENRKESTLYTQAKFDALTEREKHLHKKAFVVNRHDPHYHELETLTYQDGDTTREMKVPKGDIFQEFRNDVSSGKLPTVSWLVAPENFSDHPSSAWFGAWYISEVMDILTQNPEVWKKTIFVLTYDENDGYFDHVPPFVSPHPDKKDSGFVSKGIDARDEFVYKNQQSSDANHMRESPIGLGYRVPLVIASPWSRGGWVCSEVFDHTSSLQFLEHFLSKKYGKKVAEPNISTWRRTVCGDLTSVFRKWNNEKIETPTPIKRDPFVESIHKAKFKKAPENYKALSAAEVDTIKANPHSSPYMPVQEKGTRPSCALPYELYVEGGLDKQRKTFQLSLKAGNHVFGATSAGAPFSVYVPAVYNGEQMQTRAYAVTAGDTLHDAWELSSFENSRYHIKTYGPNGFFREFTGNANDPALATLCNYVVAKSMDKAGKISLSLLNESNTPLTIVIADNAYKTHNATQVLQGNKNATILLDVNETSGWYDFTVTVQGNTTFSKRYAGRIDSGAALRTDPAMGH